LEINNEREKIGQRIRMAIEDGKLTPEQARERFTEWKKNQASSEDSRTDNPRKRGMRDMATHRGEPSNKHRFDRGG